MGENHFARLPVALYGVVLLMAAIAYYDPGARAPRARTATDSVLARAIGSDLKGNLSLAAYVLAILIAFAAAAGSRARSTSAVALDLARARPAHRARARRRAQE